MGFRDRGTQKHKQDFGCGQVCTEDGVPIAGDVISSANQEHGIVALASGVDMQSADPLPAWFARKRHHWPGRGDVSEDRVVPKPPRCLSSIRSVAR
jgi:hypothetical protein